MRAPPAHQARLHNGLTPDAERCDHEHGQQHDEGGPDHRPSWLRRMYGTPSFKDGSVKRYESQSLASSAVRAAKGGSIKPVPAARAA